MNCKKSFISSLLKSFASCDEKIKSYLPEIFLHSLTQDQWRFLNVAPFFNMNARKISELLEDCLWVKIKCSDAWCEGKVVGSIPRECNAWADLV